MCRLLPVFSLALLFLSCAAPPKVSVIKTPEPITILQGYRYAEGESIDWIEQLTDVVALYEEAGKYYLSSTKLTIEKGVDDCTGDSVFFILGEDEMVFLTGFSSFRQGEIKTVSDPLNTGPFLFNGKEYTLTTQGITEDNWRITDFKIILACKSTGVKQVLVDEPLIEGGEIKVIFAGDLDSDGLPDFIISAPTNYELSDIRLFLSSTAKEGELVHQEAHNSHWHDC